MHWLENAVVLMYENAKIVVKRAGNNSTSDMVTLHDTRTRK